jgi:OFA family oxalate/formate antiporter-like MFS transporter
MGQTSVGQCETPRNVLLRQHELPSEDLIREPEATDHFCDIVAFLTMSDGLVAAKHGGAHEQQQSMVYRSGGSIDAGRLGAVYAWSVFRIPLSKARGWNIAEVTTAFEIAIFVLGLAAFAGGLWMKRMRPAPGRADGRGSLWPGYDACRQGARSDDVVFDVRRDRRSGLGLGYIVPIATLVRWFPDKRGMITGLAVAGFGAGALVTAPAANALIASVGVGRTFEVLGLVYLVVVFVCALAMRNPPEGYAPAGYSPSAAQIASAASHEFTLRQALGTWQWYGLWLTLFLNTTAGISIISQASPMAQEISNVSAATAAGMVGLISIANGSGRFLVGMAVR